MSALSVYIKAFRNARIVRDRALAKLREGALEEYYKETDAAYAEVEAAYPAAYAEVRTARKKASAPRSQNDKRRIRHSRRLTIGD